MRQFFICIHCGRSTRPNPRLIGKQLYCGSKPCQQARKNKWEKDKLKKDKVYNTLRKEQKAKWRAKKPCDQYQNQYRESHPEYVKTNAEKQKVRNKNRTGLSSPSTSPKIVKTDALPPESLFLEGLYILQPYCPDASKKIVKTDALIVALQPYQGAREQEPIKRP